MNPTPWVIQEQWRRYIIGAMLFAGGSMVTNLKPGDTQHDAQRPQDQGHQHLRINSQEGENPRRRGEEQRDENKVKEIRMTTMKRSLGCGFIKHT